MELEIYQVDSFTAEAFKGNPAGVCITEGPLEDAVMFSVAREMALSETAFLSLPEMQLRWFTPQTEVKLCGHGTLAVAQILKEKGLVAVGETVVFNTLSGPLSVTVQTDAFEMDFPAPVFESEARTNHAMLDLLGVGADEVMAYHRFDEKELIIVDSEQRIRELSPDFTGLSKVPGRGVVVTARSSGAAQDFICRYFAPWVGVNEDPVTGSAFCALAVYWCEQLGKSSLSGYQASERGGLMDVSLSASRVKLTGRAVTVLKGVMFI
ncbi:PhzF family phenazine biosynthesis protein [Vibrio quintilis]|uniref:Putative isomerase YddE n=1 Tax=Vibrio quintilis TaxID=1117707 RepID=A0A1M7YUQ1_9VIBR|nr:PhzF family phenazine biosynthesis isomerase [Vibrio quintilis]SHO56281.1 putative isomerase YddE [Vibrio quintilis]